MKRFLAIAIALVAMFAFLPSQAQDVIKPDAVKVDQAAQMPDFSFGSFALLVAVIPFVVEGFKRLFRLTNSRVIQVVSWGTGLGVTAVVWALDVGFVSGLPWYEMLVIGLFASLAANGAYDIGIYTYILKILGIKTEVNEPPNQAAKPKSVERKL